MCGIFGIVAHNSREFRTVCWNVVRNRSRIAGRMIRARSCCAIPFPSRLKSDLGNRRLAILDLSPLAISRCTMPRPATGSSTTARFTTSVTFGTNFERLGTNFVSHSDTEVVLKAYARWGEACLAKFRGMFAFALWDARRHRLLLARDPMGIKPLYYAQSGSYFVFASEVRTLLGTGLVQRSD